MRNAWIPQPQERRERREPLLLIPKYSGINKGQRDPDRSKTPHRKPLVKCFLTSSPVITKFPIYTCRSSFLRMILDFCSENYSELMLKMQVPKCFSCGSAGKESACNAGDLGLVPGLGRSPGEGKGYSLQYSGLENSMDCIVHGVMKSWTWLSDFHFFIHFPKPYPKPTETLVDKVPLPILVQPNGLLFFL